jgi:glycosyltransferase involved in cell wall biosynthesis
LRILASAFDVSAFFFFREATRADPDAVEEGVRGLSDLAHVQAFPIPQESNRFRLVWDHLRSALGRRPYTVFAYDSRSFRSALQARNQLRPFHLLHLDSLDLSGHLDTFYGRVPIVCSHHNVESSLLLRRIGIETRPTLRAYFRHQARRLAAEERRWIPRMDLNLVVSEPDERQVLGSAPEAEVMVVPNCVDTEYLQPAPGRTRRKGVVFLGGYSWQPNRDAMTYFSERILPKIREGEPDYPVTWLARTDQATCRALSRRYDIEVVGYVEDVRPWVQSAACYAVPLRVGGGTRLKIVEAWALGSAVVSTTVGAEGLVAEDGENILLADTEDAFCSAVLRVIRDQALRDRLAASGRRTAEGHYDWDRQAPRLLDAYRRCLEARGGR